MAHYEPSHLDLQCSQIQRFVVFGALRVKVTALNCGAVYRYFYLYGYFYQCQSHFQWHLAVFFHKKYWRGHIRKNTVNLIAELEHSI